MSKNKWFFCYEACSVIRTLGFKISELRIIRVDVSPDMATEESKIVAVHKKQQTAKIDSILSLLPP